MKLKHLPFIFLIILCNSAIAQTATTPKLGSWAMFFGQVRIHDKWSIHAEAQYRDHGILEESEQILLRTGINYHINPTALVTAGYAHVDSYPYDGEVLKKPSSSENRLWQQLIMKNNISRVFFEHRYRLEQRWIEANSNTRYLNRVRYLFRATLPLNKKTVEKNAVFLSFYDEIFVHINSTPFDRNRIYGAVGYQFSPHANTQLGYMAQTVNSKTKSYLQVGLTYNLDLRKK